MHHLLFGHQNKCQKRHWYHHPHPTRLDQTDKPGVYLHAPNGLLILVSLEVVEVGPPLEEHGLADELEPRSEAEALILEHGLELFRGDVFAVFGLVGVDVQVNVTLGEQDVVNCGYVSIISGSAIETGCTHSRVRPTCRR